MQDTDPDLLFCRRTYRLRNVRETIEDYHEHFWRDGHGNPASSARLPNPRPEADAAHAKE
jgi:hypothetical protein